MAFEIYSPLVLFIFCLFLLFLVLWKSQRNVANRFFCLFLLSMALWALGAYFMRSSPNTTTALRWEKLLLTMISLTSTFFYCFVLFYTSSRLNKSTLIFPFLYILLVSVLMPTNMIVEGMDVDYFTNYRAAWGPMFYVYILPAYLLVVLAAIRLYQFYKTSESHEVRNRTVYIVLGAGFSLIGGLFDLLPVFGLEVRPGAVPANLFFCSFTTLAIVKYHLLDINLVIRKGTAYLLMSVLIAIPYGGIILGVSQGLGTEFPLWGYILMIIVLAFAINPLWQWVQDRVDRLFYRERYDYLKGLEEFGQQMRSIIELDSLASSTISMIINAMQVRHACLMMPSVETGDFAVVDAIGLPDSTVQCRLRNDSPVVRWLEKEKRVLFYTDVTIVPQLQTLSVDELENLHLLGGELYIPLSVQDRLIGILVLGQKLSQQPFTSRDLQLLSAVSSQIAISLENARLYQREKQRAGELARLQQSSSRLASELDLELLCQEVAKETALLLQADAAAFFRIENDGQSLLFRAVTGFTDNEYKGVTIPLHTVIPQVLWDDFKQDKTTVLVSDVTTHPVAELEFIKKEDLHSMLAIPVIESGQLVNVIAVFNKQYSRWFSDEDINMARAFARNAALAIENARLYGIERQQRLELERLDEMRSDFFIAVSHELKTPLTAIRGAGEIILDEHGEDPDTPEGQLFNIITRNVQRMENRLQELLDFVKIQSETLKLELKDENICQAIEEATSLNLPTLWARKQNLKTELLDTVTTVQLDHNRFEQIITNLLTNASKYSPQDSEISVSTRIDNSTVVIDVSDRGRGIAPELHEKIFEPYFRVESNTSGLGIGLNIAKKLTELHGGRMWVNSRDGGGTVFSFSLPIKTNQTITTS